jgi:hypothetical protein
MLIRIMNGATIVCQINILVGVQALAWFCQTKVWTPFSESLYSVNSDSDNKNEGYWLSCVPLA